MVTFLGIDVSAHDLFTAAQVAVIAAGSVLVARLLNRLFNRLAGRAAERGVRTVSRILQLIVYLVAIVAVLATLDIDVSSLVISLGAVSIAISFALSTLINNLIAGFLIQADGSVRVGDNVSFGGIDGRVVVIRARATTVATKDGALVYVPNGYFMSNPVVNRGRDAGPGGAPPAQR